MSSSMVVIVAKPLSDERNLKTVLAFLDKEHQRALFITQNDHGELVASLTPPEPMNESSIHTYLSTNNTALNVGDLVILY